MRYTAFRRLMKQTLTRGTKLSTRPRSDPRQRLRRGEYHDPSGRQIHIEYVPEPEQLGIIDVRLNGLDASDRDNEINIRQWPVKGLYLPDAIASYKSRSHSKLPRQRSLLRHSRPYGRGYSLTGLRPQGDNRR
jgi:hypothetical protein